MGPYKITEFKPSTLEDVLVWYDGWRHGYWETGNLFVVYRLEDLERTSVNALWWAPLPPSIVED